MEKQGELKTTVKKQGDMGNKSPDNTPILILKNVISNSQVVGIWHIFRLI